MGRGVGVAGTTRGGDGAAGTMAGGAMAGGRAIESAGVMAGRGAVVSGMAALLSASTTTRAI